MRGASQKRDAFNECVSFCEARDPTVNDADGSVVLPQYSDDVADCRLAIATVRHS